MNFPAQNDFFIGHLNLFSPKKNIHIQTEKNKTDRNEFEIYNAVYIAFDFMFGCMQDLVALSF